MHSAFRVVQSRVLRLKPCAFEFLVQGLGFRGLGFRV